MEEVAPGFRAFVARNLGDEGRAWLDRLPLLAAELAARWGLELGAELPGGALSCVLGATRDGAPVVLKLAGPWAHPADEALCLAAWAGEGAPLLLEADAERGALLLERVDPGALAVETTPTEVAALLRRLQLDALDGLPELEDVVRQRLARAVAQGRLPADRAARAAEALGALQRPGAASVLLHGDFDERNLLRSRGRGLVAIDPLPCVGDAAYDAAYWAHANGRPGRRERQSAIAAALALPLERLRQWGVVVAAHG
ncbi:MAG: aminoglycoside phosphotransferase family protein [Gaiella sp.]